MCYRTDRAKGEDNEQRGFFTGRGQCLQNEAFYRKAGDRRRSERYIRQYYIKSRYVLFKDADTR